MTKMYQRSGDCIRAGVICLAYRRRMRGPPSTLLIFEDRGTPIFGPRETSLVRMRSGHRLIGYRGGPFTNTKLKLSLET